MKRLHSAFEAGARGRLAAVLCACLFLGLFASPARAGDQAEPGKGQADGAYRIDFPDPVSDDKEGGEPKDWKYKGKFGTPSVDFHVVKDGDGANVLKMKSDKGSGALLYDLSGKVDLNKLPIMRWKWKVAKLPAGADGRDSKKDDQAIGIYVGSGKISRQSVAYRWETDTPVGSDGKASYGGGMVSVKWYCLRNASDSLGKWQVEERNVAEDLKAAFGKIPDNAALSVSCNSQYTGGDCEACLEYVEFLPAASAGKTSLAEAGASSGLAVPPSQ